MLADKGVELEVRVYVTCDDKFTTGEDESKECGCACDKSAGPCCCVGVSDSVSTSSGSDSIREVVSNEKGIAQNEKGTAIKVKSRSSSSLKSGTKSKVLPCAVFQSGRPDFYELLWGMLERAEGETGVGVCGPMGLGKDVRRTVVRCSDERAANKGTGAQGVYLHSEGFGW